MNYIFLLMFSAILLLGCTSNEVTSDPTVNIDATVAPTTQPQATIATSNTQNPVIPDDTPIDEAVEQMKKFMEENPNELTTSTKVVEEDQAFAGSMSRSGKFRDLNYATSGGAMLESNNGKNFLVFGDDFSTPNGPDVVVYLTKNSDASTRDDIKEGIELAKLKSTSGKQVYEIPVGVNIEEYNSVTLHCKAFNVPWSYAPLG